jgi:hypothetical protein
MIIHNVKNINKIIINIIIIIQIQIEQINPIVVKMMEIYKLILV